MVDTKWKMIVGWQLNPNENTFVMTVRIVAKWINFKCHPMHQWNVHFLFYLNYCWFTVSLEVSLKKPPPNALEKSRKPGWIEMTHQQTDKTQHCSLTQPKTTNKPAHNPAFKPGKPHLLDKTWIILDPDDLIRTQPHCTWIFLALQPFAQIQQNP